jgi:hypothetical protein
MNFINDVDLKSSFGGSEVDLFSQIPYIVNPRIRRRIDLD